MTARTALLIAAAWLRDADAAQGASPQAQLLRAGLEAAGAPGRRWRWLASHPPARALSRIAERLLLPGIAAHYRWRKALVEAWVGAATEAGNRQVVFLGSGLDTLPWRLAAAAPASTVFELDRAPAMAAKRKALAAAGVAPCDNLHLAGADLGDGDWPWTLRTHPAFRRGMDTLVVAEGVPMYLPAGALVRAIAHLRRMLAGRLRIVATAMERDPLRGPRFRNQSRWVDRWLRDGGEAFAWGLARGELAPALARAGLRLSRLADPDRDPCPGEWVFEAEADDRASGDGARRRGFRTPSGPRTP